MPRYAANLQWLFTEHAFLDRIGAAAAAGFPAVEFPTPYDHPAESIRERTDRHGVQCVLFNTPSGNRALGDFGLGCRPEREAEFREGVGRAIEYARVLGVKQVNVISGKQLAGDDPARLRATLVGNLRFAARERRAAGLDLLLEPINDKDTPGFFVPTASAGVSVIQEVAEPNLFLQCDLYHTAMMGDDPAAVFTALRPLIRHVQFADAPGRGEPGTGKLPFPSLFSHIDASDYAGWVSAEYRPSSRTEDTLGWLRATA